MNKAVKYTFSGILIILIVGLGIFCYGGWQLFGDELKAMRSLKMIDEGLYTFTFKGDYGFKQFLEQGGAKTDREMARYIATFLSKGYMKMPDGDEVEFDAGCSTIATSELFCRNFDFGDKGQNMVIVRTYPNDAYASIATSSFAFIGLGEEWHPIAGMDGMTALATVYIPFDGINEKGLCVADLIELDGDTTDYDTERPDLTIVGAIRLVLDYAADVEEAIRLLGQYDIHNSIGWAHHLSIADAERSVVVEWKTGRMHVTDTPLVTNHCMWEQRDCPLAEESHRRMARMAALRNPANEADALSILKQAAYDEWTIWSVIFNREKPSGTWFIRRNWSNPHTVEL